MHSYGPLIPIVLVAAALVVSHAVNRNVVSRYNYVCPKCGASTQLSPWVATIAPHSFGGSKFVRCPSCGRRAWLQPTPRT